MEILAKASDWAPFDAEQLSKFLDTDTGRRLFQKLGEGCPELLEAGETNAILIRCGMVRSYGKMLENLFTLAHAAAPQQPTTSEYPPLESDDRWQDGRKLDDPNPPEFQVPPPETPEPDKNKPAQTSLL